MIAAGAVHPGLTIPAAIVVLVFLVWFWMRLGGDRVPASRRFIRRCSVGLMLLTLPTLVAALSFFDPNVDQRKWITAWTIVTFLLLLIILSALVDAFNSVHLHRRERRQVITDAAADLIGAMHSAREAGQSSSSSADQARPSESGAKEESET